MVGENITWKRSIDVQYFVTLQLWIRTDLGEELRDKNGGENNRQAGTMSWPLKTLSNASFIGIVQYAPPCSSCSRPPRQDSVERDQTSPLCAPTWMMFRRWSKGTPTCSRFASARN